MKYIKCDEVLNKTYFESHSEFYFALVIARELGRRGCCLDVSNMKINADSLPDNMIVYFKKLVNDGYITTGNDVVSAIDGDVVLDFDTKYLYDLGDSLFKNIDDTCYHWDYSWAKLNYKNSHNVLNVYNSGNFIMHMFGYVFVNILMGTLPNKKLVLSFDVNYSKTTYLYIDILSCCKSMSWLNNYVLVDIDCDVDINYVIHCNNSKSSKRHKFWEMGKKIEFLKEYGIVCGSIVLLFERTGICSNNKYGKICNCIVARVNEITKDGKISLTKFAVNKTREEREMEYYSIAEENRWLFLDMYNKKPSVSNTILGLHSVGIGEYFYDESYLITLIDKYERVTKRITIDGKEGDVEMSGIDAIYWLLCQDDLDFDRDLYKNMYSDGQDLLWDKFGTDDYE